MSKSSSFVTSLKTISVLLIICIVCGALLALCNDLFYIDEETKFNRAMQKVYPEFERDTSVSETPVAEFKDLAGVGNVSKVYASKDGTYILESIGVGGFSSGTVTMYVAIGGKNPDVQIKSLVVTGNVGQSWMAKVGQKELDKAYVGKNIKDISAVQFGADYKLGGTTYTSTAILNAVKAAVNYCVTALKLVSTPESEARDAAVALLAGYTLTTVVDEAYTTELGASFYFTGTKDGADNLDVYVFGNSESGHQIVALKAGLKHADRILDTAVVAKSEGIDNALVQKVQGLSQLEAQIRKSAPNFTYDADGELGENAKNDQFPTAEILNVYKSNDGAMAIVVQAPGFRESTSDPQLTVMVIIAEGKIAGWELISAGSNNQFSDYTKGEKFYIGASIDGTIEKQIVSGSTLSGNALYEIVNLAALYARTSI
ncbi:MAG: hypothetical protein IKC58_04795 [Clostridia bacterium]|nr:hypothetical protein [Clostridia bacterium]